MIRVLGIDPGGTSGLAVLEHHYADLCCRDCLCNDHPPGWELTPHSQQTPGGSTVSVVRYLLDYYELQTVAIERFVVSRRAGRSKSAGAGEKARNIIGAVTALCQESGVPLVTYSASQVKAWATDKRLEAAGLLAPTRGLPHARDAARHALHAAVWRCGLPDPLTTKEK